MILATSAAWLAGQFVAERPEDYQSAFCGYPEIVDPMQDLQSQRIQPTIHRLN